MVRQTPFLLRVGVIASFLLLASGLIAYQSGLLLSQGQASRDVADSQAEVESVGTVPLPTDFEIVEVETQDPVGERQ